MDHAVYDVFAGKVNSSVPKTEQKIRLKTVLRTRGLAQTVWASLVLTVNDYYEIKFVVRNAN